jgi:hypothetical protein
VETKQEVLDKLAPALQERVWDYVEELLEETVLEEEEKENTPNVWLDDRELESESVVADHL